MRQCGSAVEVKCNDLGHWLKRKDFAQSMKLLRQQDDDEDDSGRNRKTVDVEPLGVLPTPCLPATLSSENVSVSMKEEDTQFSKDTPSTAATLSSAPENREQCTFMNEYSNSTIEGAPCQSRVLSTFRQVYEVTWTFKCDNSVGTSNSVMQTQDQPSFPAPEQVSSSSTQSDISNDKDDSPVPRNPDHQQPSSSKELNIVFEAGTAKESEKSTGSLIEQPQPANLQILKDMVNAIVTSTNYYMDAQLNME